MHIWESPPDLCIHNLRTAHSTSSSIGTESSTWAGVMDVKILSLREVMAQYNSTRSSVISSSVIRAGGRTWSTAALYHPLILLHDSRGRGESPVKIRSTSSTAASTHICLSPFNAARNACPIHNNLLWYCPVPRLTETLSLMIIHISSNIHELWRATQLSGFGTARCKSVEILFACVLV